MSRKNVAKTVALMGAAAVTMFGLASPASAVVVGPINTGSYNGRIEIQYNGFSTENNTTAGTNETTWGAGFVTSIFAFGDTGNNFYSSAIPGIDRIGFLIYGIADGNIIGPDAGGNFDLYNIGCTGGPCDGKIHVDFYLKPNASSTDFGTALTISDRTGFDDFVGITDGTLFMQWELVPGFITSDVPGGTDPTFDETLTTLYQNVNATTLPAAGNGNFYANCVSGPGCAAFGEGGYPNGADFFCQFDLSADLTANQARNGWQGRISDPCENEPTAVPEPATLSLFGLGLLGLAARRRLKKQA